LKLTKYLIVPGSDSDGQLAPITNRSNHYLEEKEESGYENTKLISLQIFFFSWKTDANRSKIQAILVPD
jgi:hypothetical protein